MQSSIVYKENESIAEVGTASCDGLFLFLHRATGRKASHSTFVPGAESSNTVCIAGLPEKPSSLRRRNSLSRHPAAFE
jgi:hypothetical protein